MKKLIFFCCFLIGVIVAIAQELTVIENPPFSVASHANVVIEKVVITPAATQLHMAAWHSPRSWVRFSSETYIRVAGEKLPVNAAEGIELDKEVYSDETNKTSFVLNFSAIDPKTENIDFIESDCEDCFKIWGVELQSKELVNRLEIPQNIRERVVVKDDGAPLEIPQWKNGEAILKGRFLGYRPEMEGRATVYIDNPITGEQEEYKFQLDDDGSFEKKIPLISTYEPVLFRSLSLNEYILLSPDKESYIYVDLQQKSRQETMNESLQFPQARYIYFDGANAEINNQMQEPEVAACLMYIFSWYETQKNIVGMTAAEYKSYILNVCNEAIENLSTMGLTRKAFEYASEYIRGRSCYQLMYGSYFLESAYRRANNLKSRDELTGYVYPVFDKEYYSFIKDLGLNNMLSLYGSIYSNNVNSCQSIIPRRRVRINDCGSTFFQKLIDSGTLTAEEKEVAEFKKETCMDSWGKKKVKKYKQYTAGVVQALMNSLVLTDIEKEQAQTLLAACKSSTSSVNTVIEDREIFRMELIEARKGNETELNQLESAVVSVPLPKVKEKKHAPEEEQIQKFHEKFNDEMKLMITFDRLNKEREYLAEFIGVSEGVLFDLITTQALSSKLETDTPLADAELEYISGLQDLFYSVYLGEKSRRIAEQNAINKLANNYTIHPIPEIEGVEVLDEIMKGYTGKVVMIDFWATWCGPCRSAMKQFESAKKSLQEKGVVFIYLTDATSPLTTWENMIINIAGEHYRLKDAQFSALKKKFNFGGIPSYLILNKKGEVVYSKTGFEGTQGITIILERELAK